MAGSVHCRPPQPTPYFPTPSRHEPKTAVIFYAERSTLIAEAMYEELKPFGIQRSKRSNINER